MNKYFVYFSVTCNGDFLANELAKKGYIPVKIELVKPYVSNMITFEFSHFLSPQADIKSARTLYNKYQEYYNKYQEYYKD